MQDAGKHVFFLADVPDAKKGREGLIALKITILNCLFVCFQWTAILF